MSENSPHIVRSIWQALREELPPALTENIDGTALKAACILASVVGALLFGIEAIVNLSHFGPLPWGLFAIVVFFSVWLGCEVVFFRFGWYGRKARPRLWIWMLVIGGIVIASIAGIVLSGLSDLKQLGDMKDLLQEWQATGRNDTTAVQTIAAINVQIGIHMSALVLDGVAVFPATLVLLSGALMPRQWDFNGIRIVMVSLFILVGWPAAMGFHQYLVQNDQTPDLAFKLMVGPPISLPFAGFAIVLVALLAFGIMRGCAHLILVTLPLTIFDWLNNREKRNQMLDQKKAGLAGYMMRFDAWLRHEVLLLPPDDRKGSRFATLFEVMRERVLGPLTDIAMAFGHVEGEPLFLTTDKHLLLMASTRSGKGVSVIIPHLLRYEGSAFILDPKGENARATGAMRRVLNATIHYLDPFGISGKPMSRFNPLSRFTLETMEANSKALAAALILEARRDHWTASAQQLLAALILYVFTATGIPDNKRDLVTVRKLLLGAVRPTLLEMSKSEEADGLIADLAASFLATQEKELSSIISTAQRETEILDNPAIAACLSAEGDTPEVDFSVWHRSTMSVFLCLSAPKFPVFNRWLRLVLTSALEEMTDKLDPPAVPVCFLLDEMASLGHMPAIENAIGLAAGYGIQLVSVFQDIAQMKDLYSARWSSFIANSGIRALFNLDDYDTARYWSDFIGGHLFQTTHESQDIYGVVKSKGAGETQRAFISPDDIMMRYASHKMLVLKTGMRPIESDRVPYWKDASLDGLWEDPRVKR